MAGGPRPPLNDGDGADRQVEQAKAAQRWAWWHSWINTAIAVGGFVLAIVALWRGQ